ncbi:bidirectional sugar transporter SWEET4 [Eucalyptus grandis]|uniref:bidirectional sugar transporter SWEET4 n=1 Tax=Eucalyptus grandis TaxID=71139 RepID=UPI00192EB99C|nr:bidirectional sugar transporter SWEET4 [Eucalyptus grandis]
MVTAETARNVVGIIGNVISFGLFLSPCPTFYRIVKNKSVEEFKVDPYLATVLNCIFWVLYGLPFVRPDSILIATINGVGLVLELIYICIFFFYAPNKERKKVIYWLCGEVIFIAAVSLAILLVFHDHKRRILAFGIICDVFNIIMYSSPLTIMKKVITTKSVEYMPFYLSLANFLNGCVDCLILYGWYFRSTPRDEKVVELKASQIQLSVSDGPDRVITKGFKLLQVMKSGVLKPNTVIYNTLLHALCKNGKVIACLNQT